MKTRIVYYLAAFLILTATACQSGGEQQTEEKLPLTEQIKALEDKLFSEMNAFDATDADLLIKLYKQAAKESEDKDIAAEYWFRAADLMMYHADPLETIGIYDHILTDYPEHEKAPMSLFLKAFVYDTRMGDSAMAHKYYDEFIARYPDDDFALDASLAIQNLGKSIEDLIKEFEANQ